MNRMLSFFIFLFLCSTMLAQPSGGPYGPLHQTYGRPKIAGKIYYVSVEGQAAHGGDTIENPTSLAAAIERVQTGDAIVLRGGVYRTGNLYLNQSVLLQPFADEQPILKGTLIADKWKDLGNGLWTTPWPHLFPAKPADWWQRNREGKKTPLHRFNNDMVFVDGRFLQSVGWEGDVDENSYYIDYEAGLVYIGANPQGRLVEITAFDAALIRTTKEVHGKTPDRKGPVIRGIIFTQYAYRALEIEGTEPEGLSAESQHGKQVVGTRLEHCEISFCSRVAGYLRGDSLVIRHCRVSDTSTEGIYIISSNDVLLEQNIFTRNNIENITGYYPAAVKIFNQCYRVTCRDNLVINLPNSNGIWYDVGNVDGVFINNWIEGVGRIDKAMSTQQLWPSDNGFFFEISKGAVCSGNVFVNCDHGLMILNASDVFICHNTFINSVACIGRNARVAAGDHFGWHAGSGPDLDKREGHVFINNLLYGDKNFTRPLLFVWQPPLLCDKLTRPQLQQLDYNAYVYNHAQTAMPVLLWSPADNADCQAKLSSLAEFGKLFPEFAAHSREFPAVGGPVFTSVELGRYQVWPAFPGANMGTHIPAAMAKRIGQIPKDRYVGAYPVLP